jgi:DNA-binding transcriptional regulator YiaG
MKAETFKGVQRELGLTNKKMATLLRVSLRTVEKWRQGARAIPGPVEVVLALLQKYPAAVKYLVEKNKRRQL